MVGRFRYVMYKDVEKYGTQAWTFRYSCKTNAYLIMCDCMTWLDMFSLLFMSFNNRFRSLGWPESWDIYKQLRNDYTFAIRPERKIFLAHVIGEKLKNFFFINYISLVRVWQFSRVWGHKLHTLSFLIVCGVILFYF